MPDEISQLIREVREMKDAFLTLNAALGERCPEHDRRLIALETRAKNGNSRLAGWGDPKFWTASVIAIAALATAIAAIFGVH